MLDTTHGGAAAGLVKSAFDVGSDQADYGSTCLLLADGWLLMAGRALLSSTASDLGFAPLDATGLPDPTFEASMDGRVVANVAPVGTFACAAHDFKWVHFAFSTRFSSGTNCIDQFLVDVFAAQPKSGNWQAKLLNSGNGSSHLSQQPTKIY